MRKAATCLALACGLGLAGCGPSGPSPAAVSKPAPAGPTLSEAGPAPPALDRYGQANYDASGAYIGGHGVGTLVDNPDQTSFGVPKSSLPDISNMHCTGSSGSNAGTLNCSN